MTASLAWLMDTNIISEVMRPTPEQRVATFLISISDEAISLASITAWEILAGIGCLTHGRCRRSFAESFYNLVDELFADRIVNWTLADAGVCAQIMEIKRRWGESLDRHVPDACLAATVATHGFGVMTRNTSEFRDTGIETINPWTD